MSEGNSGDQDLRDAFSALKEADISVAPPFIAPEIPAGYDRRSWKLRPAIPVLVAGVAILMTLLLIPNSEKSTVSTIEFDELSELISRELFTASAGNWSAPSDFLFENSEPLTQ